MAPKVEAIVGWLRHAPGKTGIITSPEAMGDAVAGRKGTRITD